MTATITPLVRTELDSHGRLVRAFVPSQSQPGVVYELRRGAGTWHHIDTRCRGWVDHGHCYHIAAIEALEDHMTTDTDETRAITVQGVSPLALMDDVDVAEIMQRKLVPDESWVYSFQVKGQAVTGVSARGVQDAARALSTQGEAIRVLDVRLEREDDRDAYFIATAARFAISPDGREIETDRTVRAKRQPKFIKLREGGEQFNEFWFEIGVTKASRNAAEALLPAVLRTYMKDEAQRLKRAPTVRQSDDGNRAARQAAQHATSGQTRQPTVREEIAALYRRAKEELSQETVEAIRAALIDAGALTEDNKSRLSQVDDDTAVRLRDMLRAQLDGEGPPAATAQEKML